MKRTRSTRIIVAILAVVLLFGLVGFGYAKISGDGFAVTAKDANDANVKIDSMEEVKLVFEKPADETGNAPDAGTTDGESAESGEDADADADPNVPTNGEDNTNQETVKIPGSIDLTYKNGKIIVDDKANETLLNALNNGYEAYLKFTASAGAEYYEYTTQDKEILVRKYLTVDKDGNAEFGEIEIKFEKIPVATVTFKSAKDSDGLTARDGSSVTNLKVNETVIETKKDEDVKEVVINNVKKTDSITFTLVKGFAVDSVENNGVSCDSLAGAVENINLADAIKNITDGCEIVVTVKKTDNDPPKFDTEITNDGRIRVNITDPDDVATITNSDIKLEQKTEKIDGVTTYYYITTAKNLDLTKNYTVEVTDLANNTSEMTVSKYMTTSVTYKYVLETQSNYPIPFLNNKKPVQYAVVEIHLSNLPEKGKVLAKEYQIEYRLDTTIQGAKKTTLEPDDKNIAIASDNTITYTIPLQNYKDHVNNEGKLNISANLVGVFKDIIDWKHNAVNITQAILVPVDKTVPVISNTCFTNNNKAYTNELTIGFNSTDAIFVTDEGTGFVANAAYEGYEDGATTKNNSGVYKLTYKATTTEIKDTIPSEVEGGDPEKVAPEISGTLYVGEPSINIFEDRIKNKQTCEGTWTITVTATDLAGNTTEPITNKIILDRTPPTIDVDHIAFDTLNDADFSDNDVTVKIPVSDPSGIYMGTITYKKDDGESEKIKFAKEDIITENGQPYLTYTFGDAGEYEIINATAFDTAGNPRIEAIRKTFTIDKTNPAIGEVTFTPATTEWNGMYYNTDRTLTVTATDTNIDTANSYVAYTVNGDTKNPVKVGFGAADNGKATASITFDTDGVYEVTKIYVADKAGRTTDRTTDLGGEFVIDKTAPAIDKVTFEPATTEWNGKYYNTNRTLTVTATDTNIDTDNSYISYTKDGNEQEPVIFGAADNEGKATASITFEDDGVYEVTEIHVADLAGNTTDRTTDLGGKFVIDKTAPKIDSVDFGEVTAVLKDHANYYNQPRPVEIKVSDTNLDSGYVIYTKDGENQPRVEIENGIVKLPFDTDGVYEVTEIYVADKAGNTTVATPDKTESTVNGEAKTVEKVVLGGEFVIDQTPPEVSVAYSESRGPANGKYYNVIRTATITIKEHNFDGTINSTVKDFTDLSKSGVLVKITPVAGDPESNVNIKDFKFPTGGWVTNGDTHTLTVTYDSNAAYIFEVCAIDMAGNNDKRVMNDGNPNTDYDFTVDKDIVPPVISGVTNGSAYPNECVPVVTFTDANFATGEVHVFRTRDGQINRDVTNQFGTGLALKENGATMTLNKFEKIPENDGIYTIVATMTDMAGNSSESRVTFSINRFGSVYKLGESLADIRGQHVKSVDKAFVITEINPDHLVDGSLKVSVTRNGKPIEVQFGVTPGANNPSIGSSGWYEYVYTIAASNFKEDGFYTITVSSTDEAGNNSSTSSFEECRMEFWVDHTPAEFTSLVGLEKAIINAKTAPVTLSVYDEIGISKITVYCDGEVIAVFEGDDINDINNFEGKFEVPSGRNQRVRIVVEDMSGNITDTEQLIDSDTLPEFMINIKDITVSTNFFVRWFANKLVFFGSILGVIVLGVAAWWFLIGKKKDEDEEEEEQTSAK